MRGEIDPSILLLTEDGAKHAYETLEAIASRMLLLVEPKCRTDRVEIVKPDKLVREVMQGNTWQAAAPKDLGLRKRIITFGKFVAAKLLEGHAPPHLDAPGFVFFHFDGDHLWKHRHLADDEKIAALTTFLAHRVVPAIDHALHEQRRAGKDVDLDAGRRAALLRLRRLTPFYSIEAWLFQNTAEARRLCAATCGKHLDQIEGWEANRGVLDEIDKPKELLPCIETKDHIALAGNAFPAREVAAAGKSYAAAVENLRRCSDLRAALARTCT